MKLVKLNTGHYIIGDDSEIKEGDWYYDFIYNKIDKCNLYIGKHNTCKKITHSTQPLDIKITDEGIHLPDWSKVKALFSPKVVKELIGEVDVEKKAHNWSTRQTTRSTDYWKSMVSTYIEAYNQALEDNKEKKYTEEDMKNALFYALNHPKEDGVISITRDSIVRKSIQSLQLKTQWEVEIVDGKLKLK